MGQERRRHHDRKRAVPPVDKPGREADQGGGQGPDEGAVRAGERGGLHGVQTFPREDVRCREVNTYRALISVLYFTVPYITVQYCTVQYNTVQYCTVLYSTIQYCTVLYSTKQQRNLYIPAQKSPWGHLAAEIAICRQFLRLLSCA